MLMKKLFTLMMVCLAALGVQAQEVWTVAGADAVFGSNWDPSDTSNEMTSTDGVVYKLTKTDVVLEAGASYELKVVKGHAWGEEYPSSNYKFSVDETGKYNVTITFRADTHDVLAEAVKTGSAVVTDVWTVAGVITLFGTSWDTSNTDNDMTSEDGIIWTLVKDNVVIEKGVTYEFKVVKGHSWSIAYPSSNYRFTVNNETATYTLTITFNSTTREISVDMVKKGTAVIGEKTWTVSGDIAICGSEWNPADEANDMEKQADGTYKLVKTGLPLEEGEYYFKIVANHDTGYAEAYGEQGGSANAFLSIDEDGLYDVTFIFNPETTPKTVAASASYVGEWTAIRTAAVANTDNTRYNMAGQRVSNGFRGIVIVNGKKMLVK